MDTVTIPLEDVEKLLSRDEGHFLDYKGKEITPARLTRTVSAFGNADGGEILLGVSEDRGAKNWIGFDDLEQGGFNYEQRHPSRCSGSGDVA